MKRLLAVCLFVSVLVPLCAQDTPVIAVLDFSTDGVSRSEMKTIINLLSSALFQTKQFTVIDVNERERLLKELEFSLAECTDESCLLEAGRMVSAERIVVGNIGKVGSRYILSTKMLETETTRTVNTADGIYLSLDDLVDDLFALADKLARAPGEEPVTAGGVAAEPEPGVPAAGEKPAKAARPARATPAGAGGNYWNLGFDLGGEIPLPPASDALGVGIPALVRFGYALERAWGTLVFEALTGFEYQGTRQDVRYGYHLLSAPLGAGVRYMTRWASPWYLSAGAVGGAAFNFVIYKEAYPFRDNLLNISPFAVPSIGVGYRLSPRLSLHLDVGLWLVFFPDLVYVALAPTIGLELALGERPALAPAAPGAEVEAVEEGEAAGAETGSHWTLHASAGANIPLGRMSEALGLGIPALVSFGYTLERSWGALDFVALTGFQYQGTRADVRYGYHLLTVPLGAEVRYTTRWESPWYLTAGAAGGAAFNFVVYKETYPFRDNLLNISALAAPSIGGGYRLSERLSLGLNAYLWMVFFTDALYVGVAPVFEVALDF